MFEELITRLLAFPQRGAVKIGFDRGKKVFCLSVPIFTAKSSVPLSIQHYVSSRQGVVFKPHQTSFRLEGSRVLLYQEIPFFAGFQATLRRHAEQFWQLSQHCHRQLIEMVAEEKYQSALHFGM